MGPRVIIDLVSDLVCPWCYVGLKSYFTAKPSLEKDFTLITRLRPYQLNPDTPMEGADREAYYQKKFPDKNFRDQMRTRLTAAAAQAGFPFDPSIPRILPNTLAAHRVIHWAQIEEKHEAVADRLYNAFWHDGADIGDMEILGALAGKAGLDPQEIRKKLDDNIDADLIRQEAEAFRAAGVSGVPTFIVNEKTGFSGALPPEKLNDAIRHALDQN